jgi:hypothetical protein
MPADLATIAIPKGVAACDRYTTAHVAMLDGERTP